MASRTGSTQRILAPYHRPMNTEQALEILADVFVDRIDVATPSWSGQIALSFYDGAPVTAQMTIYRDDEMSSAAEQTVELLPSEVEIEADRYRAFAEGVRAGMGRHVAQCEGMTGPAEFFLSDLLRDPSLRNPADFATAVSDADAQARALAPIQLADFAKQHGLSPLTNEQTARHVWSVLRERATSDAAARALVDEGCVEAIPYLIVVLDSWVDRGFVQQPVWFLTGTNGHTLLGQLLEPLLRRTKEPELVRRVDGLAEAGLFDVETAE